MPIIFKNKGSQEVISSSMPGDGFYCIFDQRNMQPIKNGVGFGVPTAPFIPLDGDPLNKQRSNSTYWIIESISLSDPTNPVWAPDRIGALIESMYFNNIVIDDDENNWITDPELGTKGEQVGELISSLNINPDTYSTIEIWKMRQLSGGKSDFIKLFVKYFRLYGFIPWLYAGDQLSVKATGVGTQEGTFITLQVARELIHAILPDSEIPAFVLQYFSQVCRLRGAAATLSQSNITYLLTDPNDPA